MACRTYSNEGVMRVSNGAAKVSTQAKNFSRSPLGTPNTSPRASIGIAWPMSVTKLKVPFASAASTILTAYSRNLSSSFLTMLGVNALLITPRWVRCFGPSIVSIAGLPPTFGSSGVTFHMFTPPRSAA